MLGSVADAEGVVQEAFLRYHAAGAPRSRRVLNPDKLGHVAPL